MLEKINVVDKIEVLENACIQVRIAQKIVEDGAVISQSFKRHVVVPGDDYSGQDARVQAICSVTHTHEVIEAYKAATAAQGV